MAADKAYNKDIQNSIKDMALKEALETLFPGIAVSMTAPDRSGRAAQQRRSKAAQPQTLGRLDLHVYIHLGGDDDE